MSTRARLLPVAALLLAAPLTPAAAPTLWTADPAKSALEFQFVQAGAKTTGRFTKFIANVDFDPANPAAGKVDVAIDMGSADTRDKERDDTLKTKELFDTASFLRATYVATQVAPKGNGFEARGKLTLRGVSKEVPITFTFVPGTEGGAPVASMQGTATLQRLAFGVGQGEWKSTEWINDDVQVLFDLKLQQRAAKPAIPATPTPAQSR
jgi:polyisoprenoid-binding protein YceI